VKWIFFFSFDDVFILIGDLAGRFDYCNYEYFLKGKEIFFEDGFKSVYATVSFSILALCNEEEYASVNVV